MSPADPGRTLFRSAIPGASPDVAGIVRTRLVPHAQVRPGMSDSVMFADIGAPPGIRAKRQRDAETHGRAVKYRLRTSDHRLSTSTFVKELRYDRPTPVRPEQ